MATRSASGMDETRLEWMKNQKIPPGASIVDFAVRRDGQEESHPPESRSVPKENPNISHGK